MFIHEQILKVFALGSGRIFNLIMNDTCRVVCNRVTVRVVPACVEYEPCLIDSLETKRVPSSSSASMNDS